MKLGYIIRRIMLSLMALAGFLLATVYNYPVYGSILLVITLIALFIVHHFEKKK
ncbi:hypothetical protein [Virgibacillus profundi]|uniref:hypothetical protein n=1 Tax=Virgibacillus profundi TaxID=2024555 RepID=UPI0013FD4FF6|nr:hypothetical protein [Virgibacillus profundi]